MRYIRREYKEYNSILKAVSNKAFTNMGIIAVTDKETVLAAVNSIVLIENPDLSILYIFSY